VFGLLVFGLLSLLLHPMTPSATSAASNINGTHLIVSADEPPVPRASAGVFLPDTPSSLGEVEFQRGLKVDLFQCVNPFAAIDLVHADRIDDQGEGRLNACYFNAVLL
jgi:hypothetical protein